jgi:hypothetical protein
MEALKQPLWDIIKNQGLSFMLLAVMTWYFYQQQIDMQHKIEKCHEGVLEFYKNDHIELRVLIKENRDALKALTQKENTN